MLWQEMVSLKVDFLLGQVLHVLVLSLCRRNVTGLLFKASRQILLIRLCAHTAARLLLLDKRHIHTVLLAVLNFGFHEVLKLVQADLTHVLYMADRCLRYDLKDFDLCALGDLNQLHFELLGVSDSDCSHLL